MRDLQVSFPCARVKEGFSAAYSLTLKGVGLPMREHWQIPSLHSVERVRNE